MRHNSYFFTWTLLYDPKGPFLTAQNNICWLSRRHSGCWLVSLADRDDAARVTSLSFVYPVIYGLPMRCVSRLSMHDMQLYTEKHSVSSSQFLYSFTLLSKWLTCIDLIVFKAKHRSHWQICRVYITIIPGKWVH